MHTIYDNSVIKMHWPCNCRLAPQLEFESCVFSFLFLVTLIRIETHLRNVFQGSNHSKLSVQQTTKNNTSTTMLGSLAWLASIVIDRKKKDRKSLNNRTTPRFEHLNHSHFHFHFFFAKFNRVCFNTDQKHYFVVIQLKVHNSVGVN